jgi:hypothetical protein
MHRPRVWCSGVGLGRQSAVFRASNMHRPRVYCGGPLASVAGVRKTSPCEPVPGRGRRFILSARFSEEALPFFFPRPAVRGEGARRAGEGCGNRRNKKQPVLAVREGTFRTNFSSAQSRPGQALESTPGGPGAFKNKAPKGGTRIERWNGRPACGSGIPQAPPWFPTFDPP